MVALEEECAEEGRDVVVVCGSGAESTGSNHSGLGSPRATRGFGAKPPFPASSGRIFAQSSQNGSCCSCVWPQNVHDHPASTTLRPPLAVPPARVGRAALWFDREDPRADGGRCMIFFSSEAAPSVGWLRKFSDGIEPLPWYKWKYIFHLARRPDLGWAGVSRNSFRN